MNTLVLDIETGGLKPESNAICSITLKVFGKDEHRTIFITPQRELIYEPQAMRLTGISMDYLAQYGVDETIAIKQILSFIRENFKKRPYVLGHNVEFDVRFLDCLFKRKANIRFSDEIHFHRKDTMYNALFLKDAGVLEIESISLGSCYTKLCNKQPTNAHSSLGDVLMTEELYKMQMKLINKEKE